MTTTNDPNFFIPYTLTNESITVVVDGTPRTVHRLNSRGEPSPQYTQLRTALFAEEWDKIPALLTVTGSVFHWLGQYNGEGNAAKFAVNQQGQILYEGLDVPADLGERMRIMAAEGSDPTPLLRFYERLCKNPSYRSRVQLHKFMQHVGIPIEPDGTFLAYKGVTDDLLDVHSRTFDNSPGKIIEMPRNQISDDPMDGCAKGLHVGARRYAADFGSRVVICRIDPEHVVSVPHDSNFEKMRVCRYEVVGFWNGEDMPATTYQTDVADPDAEADLDKEIEPEVEEPRFHGDAQQAYPVEELRLKEDKSKRIRMHRMMPAKLMAQPIGDLRKYATHAMKIVGASKMAGGKTALVAAIVKARRKTRRR